MNKDNNDISKELKALMDNFWIIKEDAPDLYYDIKRKQGSIKDFVFKNLGSRLVIHDRFIKLEKIPSKPSNALGIKKFNEKQDYIILCLTLMYLEDKTRGDVFVLSNLIDYIKNMAININLTNIPDWNITKDRRSLANVINYLKELKVIKVIDEDKTPFVNNKEAEGLYETTGLANYVTRIFNQDIYDFKSLEDFQNIEWQNQNEDKGDIRRYKVFRSILYTPAMFSYNSLFSELDYIKKMRGYIKDTISTLDYELEVTNNMALAYEYENSQAKEHFPNNKKITDIILLVNHLIITMLEENQLKLDTYETITISKITLETIINNVKHNYSNYLNKYYQNLSDEKFYEEVTDYMKNYFFITEDNDTFKLMPTINHYQAKIVAEEEKNNQLNLFEGDYNV